MTSPTIDRVLQFILNFKKLSQTQPALIIQFAAKEIDLFGFIRHRLDTWSEMGRQQSRP